MKTNTNFKKITSLLLTFIMIFTTFAVSAFADDAYSVTYTAKQLYKEGLATDYNASDYRENSGEVTPKTDVNVVRAGNYFTFDFDGESGKYNISLKGRVSNAAGTEFEVMNNNLTTSVTVTAPKTTAEGGNGMDEYAAAGTLEIFKGDSLTVRVTGANYMFFASATFTKVSEVSEEKVSVSVSNAKDYYDAGVYSGDTFINTDEAKALLVSGNNINIGKKTLNDTAYGAIVKYKVNAPENGIYKISMNLGNYGQEWIHAIKNETLGTTSKGVVPSTSQQMLWVSTWKLDNSGEFIDMIIPMAKGENIISFSKSNSDLWFKKISFVKVQEYTPDDIYEEEDPTKIKISVKARDYVAYADDNSVQNTTINGEAGTYIIGKKWARYEVNAPESGLYDVTVRYCGGKNWVSIVNESYDAKENFGNTLTYSTKPEVFSGVSTWDDGTPIRVYLNKGTNAVVVKSIYNNIRISKLTFRKDIEGDSIHESAGDIEEGSTVELACSNDNRGTYNYHYQLSGKTAIHKVNAPETGVYKMTLTAFNYCAEWINELTNETLGVTKKGIVPSTNQTKADLSQWSPSGDDENWSDICDITIPLQSGENVLKFVKAGGDMSIYHIKLVKVGEYTPEEPEPPVDPEPEEPVEPEEPEDPTKISISVNATDYIPGGAGVGYADDNSVSDATINGEKGILVAGGKWARYAVYAPEDGHYDVTLRAKSGDNWVSLVNESYDAKESSGQIINSNSSDYADVSTWKNGNAIKVYLNKGTNFVLFKASVHSVNISKLTFTKDKEGDVIHESTGDVEEGSTVTIKCDANNAGNYNHRYQLAGNTAIHKVNAPSTGVYKVTLTALNYGASWINQLVNETLGITKKGVLKSTSQTWVDLSQWSPAGHYTDDKDGKYTAWDDLCDITIPLQRGENVLKFVKNDGDTSIRHIKLEKVADYPINYTPKKLSEICDKQANGDHPYESLTNMGDGVPFLIIRQSNGKNKLTFKFDGFSAKYLPIIKAGSDEQTYTISNDTTGKSVTVLAPRTAGYASPEIFTGTEGLDINKNDIVTITLNNGAAYFYYFELKEIDAVTPASEGMLMASDVAKTNAITVDGKLNLYEGSFAEFDISSEEALYSVSLAAAATADSLVKVTVGENTIYKFIKAESTGAAAMNFPEKADTLRIEVVKGAISLQGLYLQKDPNAAVYSSVLDSFAAATNATDAFNALSSLAAFAPASDLDGIFYKDSVMNTLKKKATYTDIATLLSDYAQVVYNELTNPQVVLKKADGTAVNAIEAGAMSLTFKAEYLTEGTDLFVAIYDGDKLVGIDTKPYSASGTTLNFTVPATGDISYKIFIWNDLVPYCL